MNNCSRFFQVKVGFSKMKVCLNTRSLEDKGLSNINWFTIDSFNTESSAQNAIDAIKALQDQILPRHAGIYDLYIANSEEDALNLVSYFGLADPDSDFEKKFKELVDIQFTYETLDCLNQLSVRWLMEVYGFNPLKAIEEYKEVTCYPYMDKETVIYEMLDQGVFGDISESFYKYINFDSLIDDALADYSQFENCFFTYHKASKIDVNN
jgi:hypothetical protein